jgi:NAD(P)-dependent dehydrogenase (short-subunit alcohol dehydrogenase family)
MSTQSRHTKTAARSAHIAGDGALGRVIAAAAVARGVQVLASIDAVDCVACCVPGRFVQTQLLANVDEQAFKESIDNSLGAAFRLTRQALPRLQQCRGSLVYCVANSDDIVMQAVQTLMRGVVYQYGPQGIRANLVLVGDDVAAAVERVCFLMGDDATFISGTTL